MLRGWVRGRRSSYRRAFASSSEEYDATDGVYGRVVGERFP